MLPISQGPKWYEDLIRVASRLIYANIYIDDFDIFISYLLMCDKLSQTW